VENRAGKRNQELLNGPKAHYSPETLRMLSEQT
jgi:hypothetical protein